MVSSLYFLERYLKYPSHQCDMPFCSVLVYLILMPAGQHSKCDVYNIWLCHPLTLWLVTWRIIECEVGRSVADMSPSWTSWTSFPHRSALAVLSCSSAHKPNSVTQDSKVSICAQIAACCFASSSLAVTWQPVRLLRIRIFAAFFLWPKVSPTDLFSHTQITITFTEHNLLLGLHFTEGDVAQCIGCQFQIFYPRLLAIILPFSKPKRLQW